MLLNCTRQDLTYHCMADFLSIVYSYLIAWTSAFRRFCVVIWPDFVNATWSLLLKSWLWVVGRFRQLTSNYLEAKINTMNKLFSLSLSSIYVYATSNLPAAVTSGPLTALKYTNVGGKGSYQRVANINPGVWPNCPNNPPSCSWTTVQRGNDSLAPFDEVSAWYYSEAWVSCSQHHRIWRWSSQVLCKSTILRYTNPLLQTLRLGL